MRQAVAAGLCLLLAGPVVAATGDWTPDPGIVGRIEAVVRLPADPGGKPEPLAHYARYYAGVTLKGHRVVRAEYVRSDKPGVHIGREDDFPRIDDGGCSVVNLIYDIATARVISVYCNGYA